MSTAVYNIGPDVLEKKFFNLVVQPPSQLEKLTKPLEKSGKSDKKVEKRQRNRFDRRRLLVGNKKSKAKEELNKQPHIEFSNKVLPLQISLTPNPSAILLQSRILHEIKDAEQKEISLKSTAKEGKSDENNASDDNVSLASPAAIPQVIELGLVGVFELIRETASHHNVLCCKALQALLHMLQGQKLEGMKNEPTVVLDELFQTLLDLSRLPDDGLLSNGDELSEFRTSLPGMGPLQESTKIVNNIPSLACSCLLSLVFAWGNTEKLLAIVASFIADCSSQKAPLFIKIPATFIELQRTVMASILEKDYIPTPLDIGIHKESLFQSFKVSSSYEDLDLLSVQSDGSYLFAIFSNSLLMKIGTGYNSTVQGHVYNERSVTDIECSSQTEDNIPKQLFWIEDSLYCVTTKGSFCLIRRNDLSVKFLFKLSSFNDIWFCGDHPWSVASTARKETYTLKSHSTDGKQLLPRKSLTVRPTKQHVIQLGKALSFNPVTEPCSGKEKVDIAQIYLGEEFSISRTSNGQVYYAGNSQALGLKGKSKKVVNPEVLPLPTSSKISYISVAKDAGHAVMIAENGEVYFVGTAHRGEDGEAGKNKRQPPQKPKLMKCMDGKKVVSAYCNSGTSALITENGRLYLFGKDSTQADSKTGLVSVLNDVHVAEVALGRAHIVVRSEDGRIWTAGVNNRGQCGRQEGTISISQRIAEVEQEKDVSMPEDKSIEDITLAGSLSSRDAPIAPICSPDKHKWKMEVCMICAVCCECTGYGSSCINASEDGRLPGMVCGCGSGWSGCMECGCCKTCAGEADVQSVEKQKVADIVDPSFGYQDIDFQPPDAAPPFLNKLAMLFHQKNGKKGSHSSSKSNKGQSKADLLKEVALLPFLQVQLPKKSDGTARKAIQIACGDHHTAVLTDDCSVWMFGKNNYGQLGLGDTTNRSVPNEIQFDQKVAQVACGSHHTLLLTEEGHVYGCGSNAHGQMGVTAGAKTNFLIPKLLRLNSNSHGYSRVTWISASQKNSFIKCDKVLFSAEQLESAKKFGNSSFIGISYKPTGDNDEKSRLLLIDLETSQCHHFTEDCVNMCDNEQACIDPDHDVLWSFNASDWSVKSYLLCGHKGGVCDDVLPFTPRLAISLRRGSLTTRTQAGLNLLACLNTLVTKRLQGLDLSKKSGVDAKESGIEKGQEQKSEHSLDEYNVVSRFKRNGGGWGYSVHSTEAIRFMTDTDVVLGGVGVFGGRGEYSVTVSVYEDDGETENVSDAEPLVGTDRIPYECGFRDKFRVLFDEPVSITAAHWYTIACTVSGPSSDCGSHGEQHVVGSDNVRFTFRRSKRSNNGTDVSAGQIPELLYSIPTLAPLNEVEVTPKPKNVHLVQSLSKHFTMCFKEGVFETLPYILDWARTSLYMDISSKSSRYEDKEVEVIPVREKIISDVISNISCVVFICLRLLREAIKQAMAAEGIVGQVLLSYVETVLKPAHLSINRNLCDSKHVKKV